MENRTSIAEKGQQKALVTRLQQIPLLSKCSASYLQLMLKAARPRPFAADDVLCQPGDAPAGLYIF